MKATVPPLLDLLLEFRSQGMSAILISHKLGEVARVADRITVLRDGRAVDTLDCEDGAVEEDRIIRKMGGPRPRGTASRSANPISASPCLR